MNPFTHHSDSELMKLYKNDEYQAFEVLYERYRTKIYNYLMKRTGDQEVTNEIFQNSMLKFHKSRMLYKSEFGVLQWLYVISKSEMIDYMKRKKVFFEPLKEEHLVTTEIELKEKISLEDFKTLTLNEKNVLSLKFDENFDYQAISETLNLKESNVRKIVSRALKKIKLFYSGGKVEDCS